MRICCTALIDNMETIIKLPMNYWDLYDLNSAFSSDFNSERKLISLKLSKSITSGTGVPLVVWNLRKPNNDRSLIVMMRSLLH